MTRATDRGSGKGGGETPGLAVRVAARVIDIALVAALDVGLGGVMGFGYEWLVLGALVVLVYFAGLDVLFGATIGKGLLGLRVTGPGGQRPAPREAVLREAFTVLGAVPFAGPILALAAWIWIVLAIRSSPLGQGPHDHLAGGTRVVHAGRTPV